MKVGILGTGQLAAMLASTLKDSPINVIPFGPSRSSWLESLCDPVYADYENIDALTQFAETVDVVTYEFEHIPRATIEFLADKVTLAPGPEALQTAQDRWLEKNLFNLLRIPTNNFHVINSADDLDKAAFSVGLPAILKTRHEGYDGKGQHRISNIQELHEAWEAVDKKPCILESMVDFDREVSVIACRDINRNIIFYPLVENHHRDGILRLSISYGYDRLQGKAENYIRRLMNHFDYTGCMVLELFEVNGELYANEFAPRVHNSGHWTMEAASQSQFENHMRAITGKLLFRPVIKHPAAMINLIGELPDNTDIFTSDYSFYHDYQKSPRAGRKLGHVNVLGDNLDEKEFLITLSALLEDAGEQELAQKMFKRARYAA